MCHDPAFAVSFPFPNSPLSVIRLALLSDLSCQSVSIVSTLFSSHLMHRIIILLVMYHSRILPPLQHIHSHSSSSNLFPPFTTVYLYCKISIWLECPKYDHVHCNTTTVIQDVLFHLDRSLTYRQCLITNLPPVCMLGSMLTHSV